MNATILIVEEDQALRDVLCRALAEDGYRVRVAASGREAIDLHAEDPADLILSEMAISGADGRGLVDQLRDHRDATPIVLMSATPVPVPLRQTIPYLYKPFDLDRLFGVIEAHLEAPA